MVPCLFHLRGQCKYGDACKNEHAAVLDESQPGPDTENMFPFIGSSVPKPTLPYTIENITRDLASNERPAWPLTSYGPFDDITLVEGLDVSPEEMRLSAVAAWRKPEEYILYETEKFAAADEVYNTARMDIPQLYKRATKLSRLLKKPTPRTAEPSFVAFPSSPFTTFNRLPTTLGNTTNPFGANAVSSAVTSWAKPAHSSFAVTSSLPLAFGNSSTTKASFSPGIAAPSPISLLPSAIGNLPTNSSSIDITPPTSFSNTKPTFVHLRSEDDVTISDSVKLKRLEEELTVYKRAYAHLEVELGQWKKSKQEMERQKEGLENQLKGHRVVALLDGDGAIFHPSLIVQGQAGGHTAARKLSDAIMNFLASSTPGTGTQTNYYHLWVYVFLSKRGLAEAFRKTGAVETGAGAGAGAIPGCGKGKSITATANLLEDFMIGFNQAAEKFVAIDVGGAKEAADAKIKAFLESEIRLPQTEKIIFGGCHDNGYVTTLRSQITAGFKHKLILLPSYTEMAAGISELGLPSFTIPDLFLTKKLTVIGHGSANLDGQGPLSLSPLSTTPLGSPVMASKGIGSGEEVGNQGLTQNQKHCHGQKAASLIDRIEMLSLKEHSSGDIIHSPILLARRELSELDCSESTVAALSDYGDDDGEDGECVLMPRISDFYSTEKRRINPDIPLFKHKPPPCTGFYLSTCKRANCKYSHNYILEPEHYHDLYIHARKTPCPSKNKGEVCTWGSECYYGHYCPFLSGCRYYKQGTCKFVGPDMHG